MENRLGLLLDISLRTSIADKGFTHETLKKQSIMTTILFFLFWVASAILGFKFWFNEVKTSERLDSTDILIGVVCLVPFVGVGLSLIDIINNIGEIKNPFYKKDQ